MSVLALVHLLLLGAVAAYLSLSLEGVGASCSAVMAAALVAELLPLWLRRSLVPELLVTLVLALCWWSLPGGERNALHGLIGLAFSAWVLIPARRGSLRWMAVLAACELLLAGERSAPWTALWMVPIALAALAAEAWFTVRLGAQVPQRAGRSRWRWRSQARWLVGPSLVAIGLGLALGPPLVRQAGMLRDCLRSPGAPGSVVPGAGGADPISVGLSSYLDVGGTTSLEPDGRIAARLLLDRDPESLGMVYLRALALGDMELEGGRIRWHPAGIARLTPVGAPSRPDPSWAWIYRATGCGDVVLRPDASSAVALEALQTDRDGNLYRPRLGEAPRLYQAELGLEAPAARAVEAEADRYRASPLALDALPWERIADPAWTDMPGDKAGMAIAGRLAGRCRYALDHLPSPPPVAGGALRLFLFGDDAERRGHCQYFATATVLLLRRAGHQARCVAGFASDEVDERGMVFRALHAHAWVEVVDGAGRWQRLDPTPAGERGDVLHKISAEAADSAGGALAQPHHDELPPVPLDTGLTLAGLGYQGWLFAGVLGVLLPGAWWWLRRRQRTQKDPRRLALDRHTDEILRLALELGVALRGSTTLTEVCLELTRRTGIDLSTPLASHLAARYGEGELPQAWPLAALRAAAARRDAVGAEGTP